MDLNAQLCRGHESAFVDCYHVNTTTVVAKKGWPVPLCKVAHTKTNRCGVFHGLGDVQDDTLELRECQQEPHKYLFRLGVEPCWHRAVGLRLGKCFGKNFLQPIIRVAGPLDNCNLKLTGRSVEEGWACIA